MAERINIQPSMFRWARLRGGLQVEDLAAVFTRYPDWESGRALPTMRQLEKFAKRTRTPLGYLFLDRPPELHLPISDFRTVADAEVQDPSPDLLETIHVMQMRQDWAREWLIDAGAEPLEFVASLNLDIQVQPAAEAMRRALRMRPDWASLETSWSAALGVLVDLIEDAGVMVMASGIVGDDTSRVLSVDEFRGFVLVDEYAPLVFINNTDAKSAQMFTLAHELAHVWLGQEGVSNLDHTIPLGNTVERLCNQIAAEFLVPRASFEAAWRQFAGRQDRIEAVARQFKVSRVVAARRALDLDSISRKEFFDYYESIQASEWRTSSAGGNYYNTKRRRLGERFSDLVLGAVASGHLAYKDAYRLTGLRGQTFQRYTEKFGGSR
ncbi:MAG: XRE family transcriptional regulator [Planctomycetota bacterium]